LAGVALLLELLWQRDDVGLPSDDAALQRRTAQTDGCNQAFRIAEKRGVSLVKKGLGTAESSRPDWPIFRWGNKGRRSSPCSSVPSLGQVCVLLMPV
jgi:hypothetical protein